MLHIKLLPPTLPSCPLALLASMERESELPSLRLCAPQGLYLWRRGAPVSLHMVAPPGLSVASRLYGRGAAVLTAADLAGALGLYLGLGCRWVCLAFPPAAAAPF